jgi:virulence-associated protein VapD
MMAKTMTKKELKAQEIEQTMQDLRNLLEKAGHTVYTQVLHVSQSGMTRAIACYVAVDNEIINIDWYIRKLDMFSSHNKGGLKVGGCGMDMGFHVVYSLSCKLYRNEDGSYSHDGAYKLKQRWM